MVPVFIKRFKLKFLMSFGNIESYLQNSSEIIFYKQGLSFSSSQITKNKITSFIKMTKNIKHERCPKTKMNQLYLTCTLFFKNVTVIMHHHLCVILTSINCLFNVFFTLYESAATLIHN